MKTALFLAAVLLAGCTSQSSKHAILRFIAAPDPSVIGKTTEAELLAQRGPQLNKLTGSDGTIIYVYYAFVVKVADYRSLPKNPADWGPAMPADGSGGVPDNKVDYVFSPAGVLREKRIEVPLGLSR
jgi:hypothetical protein